MKHLIIAGLSVVLLGAGCSGKISDTITEKVIEKSTGGQVDIDSGKDKVTFTDTKSGSSLTFGEGLKLPDDFPKDVPIYPGSRVKGIIDVKQEGQGLNVTLESSDAFAQVKDWYAAEFKKGGWPEEASYLTEGSIMRTYTKDKVSMNVVLSEKNDESRGTAVIITRGENM